MQDNPRKLKLMYVLPNLFTAASAFLGVISIVSSAKGYMAMDDGNFELANSYYLNSIIYIVFSLILDGMEGRVARLTKTTSKFGVEFDSLADLVAFGVAPAMLFYFTVGQSFGRLGSLIAALFVVFGAIRLARFNVMTGTYEPSVFIGLPIPTAAIVSAFWVGLSLEYSFTRSAEWFLLFMQILLSILMVSNIRYPSFKKIDLKKADFLRILIALVVVFSLLYIYPIEVATALMSIYVCYGIIRFVFMMFKNKKIQKESIDEAN